MINKMLNKKIQVSIFYLSFFEELKRFNPIVF